MSEEEVIRWFKGINSQDEVYGIYKARFKGTTYLGEKYWRLIEDSKWTSNSRVQDWYFIGEDSIWECTEEEAKSLLPPEALE
jgi:hypothetical protein